MAEYLEPEQNPYQAAGDGRRSNKPAATSGKAIASLVLGICSLFTCVLTGIPAIVFGALSLGDINKSNGRLKGTGLATTGIILGALGSVGLLILPALLLPAIQAARQAARRSQSSNNMKMVGLSLQNAHDVKKVFPAAFTKGDDNKPLLSWRVAILPYIEENAVYQTIDQQQAWNSPKNQPATSTDLDSFECPGDGSRKPGETNILGIVDADTVLSAEGPVRMRDIRDGTSKTIVAVELAGAGIDWAEPRDITIDEFVAAIRQPSNAAGLHPPYSGGALCLMADGSVHFIPDDVDEATLRALCTKSGGEPVTVPGNY